MHYWLALIIPFFSFLLQSYPRLFNRYFGVDVWTRLLEIEHVRRSDHKIPGRITKGFIIRGFFDYPIAFPWMFSFLPRKFLLKLEPFVSPFFDVIQNFLVFVISLQLGLDVRVALLAQLTYMLTPLIPVENSYLTPRSLGYLNFTLALYPLLLYHVNGNPLFLILGFLFTCLLFLTHRFALQSFVLICLFFTGVDRSPVYVLNLLGGFILITFVTRGYYLRVLKGHLSNIYFWVVNYQYRFAHQIYGNQKAKRFDWVGKIYWLLSAFSPFFLFGVNTWAISGFIYLYLVHTSSIAANQVFIKMGLWIIFFYVFGAIVLKVKRLIPIGEGQRYLEMAMVPSSILSSVLFFFFYERFGTIGLVVFILMVLGNLALIIFVQVKGIITDKNRSLTKELNDAFTYINKLPGLPRIMCIPHQITTMTVYNTKADVLVNADNPGLMKIMDFYPILKRSVKELAKMYKLDYLLLRESFATLQDLRLKQANIVFKSGDVLLVKLA